MTREDLQKNYQTLSNAKLFEIVNNKHQYTDMALLVAIEEFARRNVSEDEIQELKEQEISNAETTLRKYVLDDLTFFQNNLFYFVWFPLMAISIEYNKLPRSESYLRIGQVIRKKNESPFLKQFTTLAFVQSGRNF